MKAINFFFLLFPTILVAQTNTLEKKVDSLFSIATSHIHNNELDQATEIIGLVELTFSENINENSAFYSRLCDSLCLFIYTIGDLPKAESWCLKAEKLNRNVFGQNDVKYIYSLNALSELYLNVGDLEKADSIGQTALEIIKESIGKSNPEYTRTLRVLARAKLEIGEFDQAKEYVSEAKAVTEKFNGKNHIDYVASLNLFAHIQLAAGNYNEAELLLLEAKELIKNNFEEGQEENIFNLGLLASLYWFISDYDKAEFTFLKSKQLIEDKHGKESIDYSYHIGGLALLYSYMGYYEESEQLYIETLKIIETTSGKDNDDYASTMHNLSALYVAWGKLEKAEKYSLASQKLMKEFDWSNQADYAASLHMLGNIYLSIGDYEKVEPLFSEALEIVGNALGKEGPDYAISLNYIAVCYRITGEYEKALAMCEEALTIYKNIGGTTYSGYSSVLSEVAMIHQLLGNFDIAELKFKEVLKLIENTEGKNHLSYAQTLRDLANLSVLQNDMANAESLYVDSKNIIENGLRKDHPDYSENLYELSILYEKQGKYLESESLMKELLKLDQNRMSDAVSFLSHQELNTYIQSFQSKGNQLGNQLIFRELKTVDKGALPTLFYDHLLFHKGFLLTAAARLNLLSSSTPASSKVQIKLQGLRRRLANEYSNPDATSEVLESLENEAEMLEKELARSVAGFAETSKIIKWGEVQSTLKQDEAAIEFVQFNVNFPKNTDSVIYAAIVLRPEGLPEFIPLFEEKSLDSLFNDETGRKADYVNGLYTMTDRGAAAVETPKRSLFDILWKPLEHELKGVKTVYYSPSGYLHRINIDAIPINDFETLADKYNLVALNSTRQLVIPLEIENKNYEIVLMGGIEYEIDTTLKQSEEILASRSRSFTAFENIDTTLRGGEWRYLPGTDREIKSLGRILIDSDFKIEVKKGFDATEEYFKYLEVDQANNTGSPTVIHLATHGYFFPDPYEMNNDSDKNIFEKNKHPMLRSGLIMAGGNATWTGKNIPNQSEDGILTAYEISQLNLSNTELVVLSACETGLGDIKGNEGVYGLQRAFKIAGVKYLIMSLWQVPDKQTSLLMTNFYRNWIEEKMEIPDAFHAAQQEMRDMGFDPYQWAGFVLLE